MRKIFILNIFTFLALVIPTDVKAAAISWDGGASTANWSDANNWSGNALPTAEDDVTINQNVTVNIAANTTINSLTLGQNGGGTTPTLNFSYNAILNGALIIDAGDLIVYSGANITHSAGTTSIVGTVNIDVQIGNATITGSINSNSKGYQAAAGTGGVTVNTPNTGGAGHGGTGGSGTAASGGISYGDPKAPTTLGSGGGNNNCGGGIGGGAIKLNVVGTLTVNGTISANAGNATCGPNKPGGGAGGSVYLIAGTIAGSTGSIRVNGGAALGTGGGGAGGRIAIYATTNNYSGAKSAYGGSGAGYGGAGTIYTKIASQSNGDILVDNNNRFVLADSYEGITELLSNPYDAITIQNYGRVQIPTGNTVTYSTVNWSTKGIIVDTNSGTFDLLTGGGDLVVPATAYLYANTARTFSSLTVNGNITHKANATTELYKLNYTITGNAVINSGGSINVDGLGYQGGAGDGGVSGSSPQNSGAGYGGRGGAGASGTPGAAYGDMSAPTRIGSGGGANNTPGGSGGGAVKLNVGGTLTISGTISANGNSAASGVDKPGGGSGGSIYLIAGTVSGNTGVIRANGGNGNSGGGGGSGGRIAIHYSSSNTYSGTLTTTAGTGGTGAQIGTIVNKANAGELVSTAFNTGDPATLIYNITWTENLASGTDAKLQLSTAPDNGSGAPGTWSDWFGPSGVDTYYTDPTGGESINSSHSDASNDQWYRYKIIFSAATNDINIPTLSDITITYVINTSPTVTITNTPSQSSTGTISVSFTTSDPEESTVTTNLAADIGMTIVSDYITGSTTNLTLSSASNLPSSGMILVDDELINYTGKSGNTLSGITRAINSTTDTTHVSGASVWFVAPATSLSGDYGSISTTGNKSITWTPTNDLINLETTTANIKILANDGNLANQVGSDIESPIVIDTKAPINNDIYINKFLGRITLSSTDGNGIYYKASNNSNLTPDGVNAGSGIWNTYTTPVSWTFAEDPSTVYIRYKDSYGNESSTISTRCPTRLSSLMIQDASNPDTEEWRLFVSWIVATAPTNGFDYYQVYRSTDGASYTPLTQINSQSQNYLIDTGLNSTNTYYYKTTIVDDHGNESDANYPIQTSGSSSRSGIGLRPDGSGGGDFTAPNISSISINYITTNSATITWTTDELSDSRIGFSTNTGYANEIGSISMGTSHTLALSNLTPDTKYYYRVISSDALNNKSTAENSLTQYFSTLADTDGPVISDIKTVVGETQAGISWSTSEESNSMVEYSVDTSYSESTSSATLDFGHSLTLTGLTVNTTYNYRVISTDSNENTSTSPSYTFTTTSDSLGDTTAPSISNISVSSVTGTSAKIYWKTNENADGKVEYGETNSYERGISEGNHDYVTSKEVTLIGLSPEVTYHYRITAVDEAGNTNSSADATFTTTAQSEVELLSDAGTSSGSNAPVITSSGATITDITGTSATLNWTTTKKSTSEVYYKIKNSLDAPTNTGTTSYVTNHIVTLVGLSPATSYEYQVKSTDVNGNYVTSSKAEFITSLPGVRGVKVVNKSAIAASVSWTTAIPTTTVVEYTNTTTRETRKYSNLSLVSDHLAELTNLYPDTVYSFSVLISDEAGNLARSDQYSFTTGEDTVGPTISGVNNRSTIIAGQNKVQTVITWTTDEPTTSMVEYSLGTGTGNYEQQTRENEDFVVNHIMVISGIKSGSVYRYRVNSKDRAGNIGQSEAYVLLTPIKEVSALDLIIQNLQSTFGWVNKL